MTSTKSTLICGDFNICALENSKNNLFQSLLAENFKQIVKYSTHIKGGLIDHVYIKNFPENYDVYQHSVYYSDHDGICISFGNLQETNKQHNDDTENKNDSKQKIGSRKRKPSKLPDEKNPKNLKTTKNKEPQIPFKNSMEMDTCMFCFKSELQCDCYINTYNF